MRIRLLLSVCIIFITYSTSTSQTTPSSVINSMHEAVNKSHKYEYVMITSERLFNGKGYHNGKSFNRVLMPNFCIYMKILAQTNNGVEILFNKAKYGNVCVINAGKFFPNISVSPLNKLLRKNQHHTIYEAGFKYSADLLKGVMDKMGATAFNSFVKMESDVMYSGRLCYKLTMADPNFSWIDYKVKGTENMYDIAKARNISEYLILYKNKFSSYEVNLEGKTIKIPSSFAKKATIYVDKVTYHPLGIEMLDEEGMFEKYEFSNVKYNVSFDAQEFTKDCPAYGY